MIWQPHISEIQREDKIIEKVCVIPEYLGSDINKDKHGCKVAQQGWSTKLYTLNYKNQEGQSSTLGPNQFNNIVFYYHLYWLSLG